MNPSYSSTASPPHISPLITSRLTQSRPLPPQTQLRPHLAAMDKRRSPPTLRRILLQLHRPNQTSQTSHQHPRPSSHQGHRDHPSPQGWRRIRQVHLPRGHVSCRSRKQTVQTPSQQPHQTMVQPLRQGSDGAGRGRPLARRPVQTPSQSHTSRVRASQARRIPGRTVTGDTLQHLPQIRQNQRDHVPADRFQGLAPFRLH